MQQPALRTILLAGTTAPVRHDHAKNKKPKKAAPAKPKAVERKAAKAARRRRHHLDRRAHRLVAQDAGSGSDPDDLLTTVEVADYLATSVQWLEIGRGKNYGPKFVRVGPRMIRYKRSDILKWLRSRTHANTSEYAEA
jgi:predicted DNA-binding transcriptional regulator AlpA